MGSRAWEEAVVVVALSARLGKWNSSIGIRELCIFNSELMADRANGISCSFECSD